MEQAYQSLKGAGRATLCAEQYGPYRKEADERGIYRKRTLLLCQTQRRHIERDHYRYAAKAGPNQAIASLSFSCVCSCRVCFRRANAAARMMNGSANSNASQMNSDTLMVHSML